MWPQHFRTEKDHLFILVQHPYIADEEMVAERVQKTWKATHSLSPSPAANRFFPSLLPALASRAT